MKKFATAALIPLFAGFLWAQAEQTTTTTTTKTTLNGTLVDAACQTTHTVHKESSSSNPDENTTRSSTTTTTTDSVDCPVTQTTTTFGLLTPEGKYMRFDEPSNTRVVEMVKGNKKWHTYITEKKPLKVRVIGQPNGDVVVVEKIQ